MNEFHEYPVGASCTIMFLGWEISVVYDNLHNNLFLEKRTIGREGLVFAPFATNVHAILLRELPKGKEFISV